MNYQANKPYPKLQVRRKNLSYAKLLLEDYAGHISEDYAIHLYLYQHFILKKDFPNIATVLEKIAEVEMHHLAMLGELVTLLGVKPIFGTVKDERIDFFSTKCVNYQTDPISIIEFDIISEQEAIHHYEKDIQLIKDPYIKDVLIRIIEDEKIHIMIFESILKQLNKKSD